MDGEIERTRESLGCERELKQERKGKKERRGRGGGNKEGEPQYERREYSKIIMTKKTQI